MFVVAGESLVDIVVPRHGPVERTPGGSPLNVAVGLARLGLPALLVSQLGDDEHGRLVVAHLRNSGVRLDDEAVGAGRRTGTATARLDAEHAAAYDFDLDWTLPHRTLPADAQGLHVGSIGAALRPGRDAVVDLAEQAHARGLFVSFDPNPRPAFVSAPEETWRQLTELAACAQLVKLSDEDIHLLAPGRDPADVAAELLGAGGATRLVVVTRGRAGAEAFDLAGSARVDPGPVDVVDTVGAGDAFMAGLVAVLLERGPDPGDADRTCLLRSAHAVAAVTCGRRGADPPWRHELPPGWPDC